MLHGVLLIQAGLAPMLVSGAAAAQVTTTVSFESDARYRGQSVSDARPAFDLGVSADSPFGLYGGVSASVSPQPDRGLHLIGVQEHFGYARRLDSGIVVDVGFADYQRWSYKTGDRYGYIDVETYAGVRRGDVSAYLFYSPHYYGSGARALYAQFEVQRTLWGPWRAFARLGLLTPLGAPPDLYAPTGEQPDGDLGVSWSYRSAKIFLMWSAAPRQPYPSAFGPAGNAAIFGAAWSF